MDYPPLVESKIPIGSGVTEAACKVLVKQRLCGSGMKSGRTHGFRKSLEARRLQSGVRQSTVRNSLTDKDLGFRCVCTGDEVEGAGGGGGVECAMPDVHARAVVTVLEQDRPVRVPGPSLKYMIPRSHPA